jgi:hypothetical protein
MTSFETILRAHLERYPKMGPADAAKLAYQATFGPGHLLEDPQAAAHLAEEWQQAAGEGSPAEPEMVSETLCRFPLTPGNGTPEAAALLFSLLEITARNCQGTMEALTARLETAQAVLGAEMEAWTQAYRAAGCPPVSHSPAYRMAYCPRYRVLRTDFARYFPLMLRLQALQQANTPAIVAIDGRCGSGKTRLAAAIETVFPCNVVHMDDYYLPKARRAPDWQQIPGGNIDFARFRTEVLLPATRGEALHLRAFDCAAQQLGPVQEMPARKLTVVEGSYCLHPDLADGYTLSVFLTCTPEEQARRLIDREGAHYAAYQTMWIPLEEQYHRRCPLPAGTLSVDTTRFFSL